LKTLFHSSSTTSSVSSDENKTLGGGTVVGRLRRRWGCRRFALWFPRIIQFSSTCSRSRRFECPWSCRFECRPHVQRYYSLQAMRLALKRLDLEGARRKRCGSRSRSTVSLSTFECSPGAERKRGKADWCTPDDCQILAVSDSSIGGPAVSAWLATRVEFPCNNAKSLQ